MSTLFPLIVLGSLLLAAAGAFVAWYGLGGAKANKALPLRALQWSIAAAAAVLALAHAFPLAHKADEDVPNIDAVTLSFLAVIVLAYLLPSIRNLKAFGVEMSVEQDARIAIDEFKKAIDAFTVVMERWMRLLAKLEYRLRQADDFDRADTLYTNFLRDRLSELKQYFSSSEQVETRIAIWLYDEASGVLSLYFSNEIEDAATLNASFKVGEGIVGTAFDERETWNEARARSLPSFVPIANEKSRYEAILCTPLLLGEDALGMLSVDRREAEKFSDNAVRMAQAAAHLFASATDAYAFTIARIEADETDDGEDEIDESAEPEVKARV